MSLGDEMGGKVVSITVDGAINLSKKAINQIMKALLNALKVGMLAIDKGTKSHQVSVKKLEKDGDKVLGNEVNKADMHGFNSFARKYNLDYSFVQEKTDKTKYTFFFKEKDLAKLEACLEDFCKVKTKDIDRSGLKERITNAQNKAQKINQDRAKEKNKSKTHKPKAKEVTR